MKEDELLLQMNGDLSAKVFSEAAPIWIAHRHSRPNLKQRTKDTGMEYFHAVNTFFGPIRLNAITPGHLKAYQIAREKNLLNVAGVPTTPWKHTAGPSRINHELAALARLLRHCGLWENLKPYYCALPIDPWSPRDVLSEEDEAEFFSKAASVPEAALAYYVACITNNTTASGGELRGLRLKHLFLREGKEISEIYIPPEACKNISLPRKIALNRTARWAVEHCYKRALALGSCDPEHFLFPFRPGIFKYDPTRPASRWFLRKSWAALREATGFHDLKPHDLRHQCITRLLENGVQPATVKAIAGHVTDQMLNYYSHVRRDTKYAAVMAIELSQPEQLKQGPRVIRRTA
jgi:integrase